MPQKIFATLSSTPPKNIDEKWERLTIQNKKISFLLPPILDHFTAEQQKQKDEKYWKITFFQHTEFSTQIYAKITENPSTPPENKGLALAIWQDVQRDKQPNSEQIETASRWLRDSASLKLNDYDHISSSNTWICVDGRGLSMFSEPHLQPQFERSLILLALSICYQTQTENLIARLARHNNKYKDILNLAKIANAFNAQCYFTYPVKLDRTTLPLVWKKIAARKNLSEINSELIQQTQTLYQILNDEDRLKENRRWNKIGLTLGLISSLQILGLIPDEQRQKWLDLILRLLHVTG